MSGLGARVSIYLRFHIPWISWAVEICVSRGSGRPEAQTDATRAKTRLKQSNVRSIKCARYFRSESGKYFGQSLAKSESTREQARLSFMRSRNPTAASRFQEVALHTLVDMKPSKPTMSTTHSIRIRYLRFP